jgi:hypothetical protein
MVLVNPTTISQMVNFTTTYYSVNPIGGGDVPPSGVAPGSLSHTAVTLVTLNAHQAAILLNQSP